VKEKCSSLNSKNGCVVPSPQKSDFVTVLIIPAISSMGQCSRPSLPKPILGLGFASRSSLKPSLSTNPMVFPSSTSFMNSILESNYLLRSRVKKGLYEAFA
jgi:hypothetical protein